MNYDLAIGLQDVDNLKPSKYFLNLINKEYTTFEIIALLKNYYNEINDFYICDIVSVRIVELLNEDSFELNYNYLKYIHSYIFQDVYDFCGNFRKVNISKSEPILGGDTVAYGDASKLELALQYDFELEELKNYKEMNNNEVIKNIIDFTSRIWQDHPFMEGNTRTISIFIIKYLEVLGFKLNYKPFVESSKYFRNALVRSNYYNKYMNIDCDNSYLVKFFENLVLNKNNSLQNNELVIKELLD